MKDLTKEQETCLVLVYKALIENPMVTDNDFAQQDCIQSLAEKGHLKLQNNAIIITAKGKNTVDFINARHNIVKDFLTKVVMISPDDIETCTSNLEHYIPEEALMQLISHMNNTSSGCSKCAGCSNCHNKSNNCKNCH